jgi:hypothetical protein
LLPPASVQGCSYGAVTIASVVELLPPLK